MSRDEVRGQEHLAVRRAALLKVFRAFASRWPRFFGPARADDLLPVWLNGTAGVDPNVLEPAAIEFAANSQGKWYPDPPAFAQFARQWSNRVLGVTEPPAFAEAQDTGHLKHASRIDMLSRRAHGRLGTQQRVSDVWGLLFRTAPSPDHRDAVRRGDVPYDVFDEAVDAIERNAFHAPAGPLHESMTRAVAGHRP